MARSRDKKTASTAWLERFNPLNGLSIAQAKQIFDAARSGDTQRLHWLYQEIETQNPVLSMCVTRRSGAAAGFNWSVAERASKNGSLSQEQKDAAETFFSNIENFADLFEHLDLALFRGFAHAQPIWEGDQVHHIELLDSWKFLKKDGAWLFNPVCDGFSSNCVSCENARLVTVERRRPVDVPALAIHIRAAVGERDWGRFLERYALPKPAITMAPNATKDDREEYLTSGEGLENGQVSVWPNGTSITDFAGGSRGVDPFSVFITHQEKTILMLATGGTLGSMAESGAGTLAGNAQQDVWESIVSRDSGIIAAAVQRSLLRPFLAAKFPGQPICVDFVFDLTQKPTPKEIFETAAAARNAGYLVDQHELEEATGFTLVKDSAPAAPQPGGFALNSKPRASGDSGDSPRAVGQILARLARQILDGSVPFEDALKAAQKELDAASLDVLSGDLEKALTEAMFTAAASSLAGSAPAAPSAGNVKNVVDANGQDHDNLGRFGKGNGGVARQPKDKSSQDNFGNANEDHLVSSPADNLARGRAVITHLLAKKSGSVDKAMYRKDTGWIGIDYGEPGNAKNGYAGGHGLSHIIAKHPGAEESLATTLLEGRAFKHPESRNKLVLISGQSAAILSKQRTGRLVITEFISNRPEYIDSLKVAGKYHVKGENK